MKHMLKGAAVGLVMLGASSVAAAAADWNDGSGSIKDMRGSAAVPVPAPTPIPIYQPNWYLRLDAGLAIGSSRAGSESGMSYGIDDSPGATGPVPFGTSSSWLNSDFDTFVSAGAGVGFYWSDRVRTDITVEATSTGKVTIDGSANYVQHGYDVFYADGYGPSPQDGFGVGQQRVNVYTQDVTKLSSVLSLVNAYYDFGNTRGFTPYVGAGLGVAVHRLNRHHATRETTCDLTTIPSCNTESANRTEYSASGVQTDFALAAALTAGVTYQVSDITALDFNYRFVHIGGSDVTLNITDPLTGNTSQSKVTIGEANEHQLRAGLRFNIQ